MLSRLLATRTVAFAICVCASVLACVGQETSSTAKVLLRVNERGVPAADMFDLVAEDLHPIAGGVAAFTRGTFGRDFIRLPMSSLDQLVKDHPSIFAYVGEGDQVSHLSVNTEALAKELADSKSQLRSYLSGVSKLPQSTFAKVDVTWEGAPANPARVVVAMAGLQSAEDSAEKVALEIHKKINVPGCVFAYPNDGPIAASGEFLVEKLREFHKQYPSTKITLVTHSMGGLVSRSAIEMFETNENATRNLGVDQLIQICPPNHGSALAEYGSLLEAAEQMYRLVNLRRSNRQRGQLLRAIVDGFGEASVDLAPESAFLAELNAKERNPAIRYAIVAGDAGPIRGRLTSALGLVWDRLSASVDEPEELDRRVRDILQCEEFLEGKGDGVVTVESAKLSGVEDFILLEINHMIWYHLDKEDGEQMIEEICSRLGVSL